jgi:choline dehydrogenase-like flavoprotein
MSESESARRACDGFKGSLEAVRTVGFTAREREALRSLADALVPRTDGPLVASASELGVPALAEEAIGHIPPGIQKEFRRLLHTVENPALNLILSGRPSRFSRLPPDAQEAYLLSWARSRLGAKRRGFHSIKRLVCFLYYSALLDGGNPAWPVMGYALQDDRGTTPPSGELRPLPVDRETELEADVAVVGSGAGGAVIAARAAEAGYRVLVLESGPLLTPATFPRREISGTDRMFDRHGLLTTKDNAFGVLQGHVAGGGTTINWMTCLHPPSWVLDSWEKDFGISGVAGAEFLAKLDEVSARLGVSTDESVLTPPSLILRRGCEALGMKMGVDFHVTPKNARGCRNRCDSCNFGCAYDAKQSTLVTYLPEAQAHGAKFLFDTEVRTIETRGDVAVGLEAVHRQDGREIPIHVKAKAVVVAAGAPQTPALLLRSGFRHRGIGRGLRFHPTTAVSGIYAEPVRMWAGVPQTLHVDRWLEDFDRHGFWLETVPAHPGLASIGFPWRGARAHKEGMARYAHTMANIVLVRDRGAGRVTIDRSGNPVLDYRMDPRDARTMTEGIVQSAGIHVAAGARAVTSLHHEAGEIPYREGPILRSQLDAMTEDVRRMGARPNRLALFSAHAMGSCPMGADDRMPTRPDGRLRGAENVFVGDASVLPTALGVNPMITIMAMALRTADFVVAALRGKAKASLS